jgi:hypothetical protein
MMEFTAERKRTSMQLAADGFAAVVEKLGMADAIRYVQLFNSGEGNYSVIATLGWIKSAMNKPANS